MSRELVIPADTKEAQARASDPRNSAWVSANAGSGKTHVLSQRVVRLLLEGTEPSKILCLTYTRAAAANMSNRVFRDLGRWTLLPDADLSKEIEKIEGHRPDAARLRAARRLFADALETPGGLKIQTIHAFCEAILQQFPLEANIAGHFEMLDSQMEAALIAEARRDMITGAADGGAEELSRAFADVLARGGEAGLDALLSEVVSRRDELRGFIDQVGPAPYDPIFEEFGFEADETAERLAASVWPLPGFPPDYYRGFVAAAEATDAATVLNNIVPDANRAFAENDPVRRLDLLVRAFLTQKCERYGAKTFKKALVAQLPDLPERYEQAAAALIAARDRQALFGMLSVTCSALTIADWLIGRYERLKSARGFLDFNDLITRTNRLLARADAGAWVHYKLDRGIDHILIDEAQDTSPRQWEVIKSLAQEFFAGFGARDNVHRTVFAVGDEKQSIYSFQGAEPAAFAESGYEFATRVAAAQRPFEKVRLDYSFRSTEEVLSAVDLVFSRDDVRAGLTRDPQAIEHRAIRAAEHGYVELWTSLSPQQVDEPDDWRQSIDHASAPAVILAETVAEQISRWIADREMIEGRGRRLAAGDVMVLVRKRDRFIHALSRALKQRGVPVAGADRLRLSDHIAVQDLMALGRFVLQPHDDLSLAALLRSPVFGLTDAQLFDIAWGRGKPTSLYSALRAAAAEDERLAGIIASLEDWRDQAGFKPAFEFFAGILSGTPKRPGVRGRLTARLGRDAGEILDEFLAFCLAAERAGSGELEAVLATLESAAPEIKREMDQSRDEVRILTVHAAKGLEAPVVFLVDPGSAAFIAQHMPRLVRFRSDNERWAGDGFLWRAGKEFDNSFSRGLAERLKADGEAEYRRLLYVGMTRAEDRLIVCGYHGKTGPREATWHGLVKQALDGHADCREVDTPAACAPVLRYKLGESRVEAPAAAPEPVSATEPLPAELLEPLPAATSLPRPLAPSGASVLIEPEAEATVSTLSPVLDEMAATSHAAERGTAMHRLLQMLPDLPEDRRDEAARRYLGHFASAWSEAEREAARDAVFAVLDDERFRPLFASGSRAEVSLMGTIEVRGKPRAVSGKIDRLAVTPGEVLIVDYKTNRPPVRDLADVPPGYVAQMALYRALLAPLYPGHRVGAALLFTEGPHLVPLPGEVMDAALAQLTGA